MTIIGSGLTPVIYSSICVFAPLITKVVWRKNISKFKWFSIFFIMGSIAVTAHGQTHAEGLKMGRQTFGMFLVLMAGFFSAADYCTVQRQLSKVTSPFGII